MQFSILDAEGKVQSQVQADTVRDACRVWGTQCWDEAIVEAAVLKARVFPLSAPDAFGAHLDPYIVAPAGSEKESFAKNEELFRSDLHFAPDPSQIQPRQVDTGGHG